MGSNGNYNNHSHDKNDGMILCEWHFKIMITLTIFLFFSFVGTTTTIAFKMLLWIFFATSQKIAKPA
jgi:hypothetical protein